METVKQLEILRIKDGQARQVTDQIITELALPVYVNGEHFTDLYCSPIDLKPLVYGHLLCEGVIQAKEDLKELTLDTEGAHAAVAASGGEVPKLKPAEFSLTEEELFDAVKILETRSPLSTSTGGVHSCALVSSAGDVIFLEDIGRHNTIDKVLGEGLLRDWDFSRTVIVTSGRVFTSTVEKALRAGVQIIISAAAPTDRAVKLARSGNLTLCGFAGRGRVNVYTMPERIKLA